MRKQRLEKVKFDVLKKQAHVMGFDPAGDYLRPGNSPSEQAFMVASCSFDLLVHLSHVAFPTVGRRSRRRGGRWLRQTMSFRGEYGVERLARAVPALMVAMDGRLSADQPVESVVSADHHLRLQRAVESFYPLVGEAGLVVESLAEFRVMQNHEPRAAVVEGSQAANEYSQALLRGENPDDDPELVRMQREYARDYFIGRATLGAVSGALEPADCGILDIVLFVTVDDPKAVSRLRARALAGWIEGLKPYLEYALVDSKSEQRDAAQAVKPS